MRFFEYPITSDTADHADRGVGPATDYATPTRTVIDAPFAGQLTPYWTDEGGYSLKLDGAEEIFHAQHLDELPASGWKEWRAPIALSGNSGSATDGPHVHCYIIIKATGKRISFSEWLRDYVYGDQTAPAPSPTPDAGIVGRRLYLPDNWYWYRNASDARVTRNPHGGDYTGEPMLQGEYWVNDVEGGAILVTSQANGRVWLHQSAIEHLD